MTMKWASQRRQAILWMALASATHFAGYEWARNAVLALFTSNHHGFSSSAAMPLAVGCISPMSIMLLMLYTRLLKHGGPRYAVRTSTLLCVAVILVGGLALNTVSACVETSFYCQHFSRAISFALIVIQSSFVQLLSVQHWSFLGSVIQTTGDAARWFAPIAGIGSLSSTIAACAVSPLVDSLGLSNLLIAGSFIIALSAYCADTAYEIAQDNGFEPKKEEQTKPTLNRQESSLLDKKSLWKTARSLFARVPVLAALRNEVLISQCISSLVSFLCVLKLKESVPDDSNRARRTGNVSSFAVYDSIMMLLCSSLTVCCICLVCFRATPLLVL